MAASVVLDGQTIAMNEGESVLDALQRNNIPMLFSCRSGVCQSCLLKAVEGPVPSRAQLGLKESLRAQGYFLSCMCVPAEDLTITLPGAALDHIATVVESDDVGAAVRRVRMQIPDGFKWFAGQYATVIREDGVARSYSIASGPADGFLELHVRRVPGGALSNWLHDTLRPGDDVRLRGPYGDCFYTPGDPGAPLLLAGTGTGLAPLVGILRHAIRAGHTGPMRLFHGALRADGLYHGAELAELSAASGGRLVYTPCVLQADGAEPAGSAVGSLDEIVLSQAVDIKTEKAYLCGDPALVERLRKKLFLKGISNRRIFADAFVPTAARP